MLLAAGTGTLVACWPLRWLALKFGIVDRPGAHKSHRRPVPYMGGIAIWAGAIGALTLLHPEFPRPALFTMILALGVTDDLMTIRVPSKLVIELSLTLAAVGLGSVWHITDSAVVNTMVSVVWIVGLTNSFNLLDNMDGLASTVAATGLLVLAVINPADAQLTLALAGGVIGFLVVNWPPARMFMGDAGSLMIGFALALGTISVANQAHGLHSFVLMVGPVAVAVFDTGLVIVSRLAMGRPIQLGGQDHFSHRLQGQGWSRWQVLAASAGAASLCGMATYLVSGHPAITPWLAPPFIAVGGVLWLCLLSLNPYAVEKPVVVEVTGA